MSTATRSTAEQALANYQRRTKRAMRLYAGILVLAVITVAALVKLAYVKGELTHVSRHSAAAPAPIPAAATAAELTSRWQTTDRPASGNPYSDGIVVTYSQHSVNGRDARTGVIRWYYTRSDETVCTVVQQDSSTIAFYDRHGNCDEITGFSTATGVPTFYRTAPDNGSPSISSAPNIVMLLTAAAVHVFDNAGGVDRWTWTPPAGCSADHALAGSGGVLISFHCANSHQLLLHALTEDTQTWTVSTSSDFIPFSVDAVIGALDPQTGLVHTFAANKGTPGRTFSVGVPGRLSPALLPPARTVIETAGPTPVEFVWAGQLVGIASPGRLTWTAAASGPPALTSDGSLLVRRGSSVAVLNPTTGKLSRSAALSPAPASAPGSVYQIGSGVLLAGHGVAFYG